MILTTVLQQIDSILDNIMPSKLVAYNTTQVNLRTTNVADDKQYRKIFTGFYKLRLPRSEHYNFYFRILESNKNNKAILFEEIFDKLSSETGRYEASFSSKIVASIDPDRPVIDDIVLGNLGLSLLPYHKKNRREGCLQTYDSLLIEFATMLKTKEFPQIKERVLNRFPSFSITDTKIIDFVLWQYRPKRYEIR